MYIKLITQSNEEYNMTCKEITDDDRLDSLNSYTARYPGWNFQWQNRNLMKSGNRHPYVGREQVI